ncbi:hypothetical protein ACTXT7_015842 [Hymenolepis weldensis]
MNTVFLKVSNASGDDMQLNESMRVLTTFQKKTISKECHFACRIISLVVPAWIDELNLTQFLDGNDTCQTPTVEPTNAENLVRGYSQCYQDAEIPCSIIP